jgi:aspartate kinase
MQALALASNRINNVAEIKKIPTTLLADQISELVLVIGAAEKTNQQLQQISKLFFAQEKEAALSIFQQLKDEHYMLCNDLMIRENENCKQHLADFFTEIEWLLHDKPVRQFNYYSNQILCLGELLSSCIISYFLNESGIHNTWIDARDIIRTDNHFTNAQINTTISTAKIRTLISNPLNAKMLVTQSNTGATDDNESTIFGRLEGTDATIIFNSVFN